MDAVGGEQLDYGATPALAEEDICDDDEYDYLYNDVNVAGRSKAQMPSGFANCTHGGKMPPKDRMPPMLV